MNKYLLNFTDEFHLDCVSDKLVYGSIGGYQMALKAVDDDFIVFLFTKIDNDLNQKLNNFFVVNEAGHSIFLPKIFYYGCSYLVRAFSKKKALKIVRDSLLDVVKFLKENGALDDSYCPICGMKIQDKEYVILDGIKLYLDKDCCDLVNEKIAKRKVEFKELPNNYLKGFLGAFLGGFVGLLLWVLIGGVLGYVSGWMSFFVFWLSDMGYSLFKGKINHKKSFMVSMVTLIFSFFGLLFSYFILANKLDVNFSNFFDSSLMGVFVGDLVLAVILYIVGVIRIVKRVDGILLELSK